MSAERLALLAQVYIRTDGTSVEGSLHLLLVAECAGECWVRMGLLWGGLCGELSVLWEVLCVLLCILVGVNWKFFLL